MRSDVERLKDIGEAVSAVVSRPVKQDAGSFRKASQFNCSRSVITELPCKLMKTLAIEPSVCPGEYNFKYAPTVLSCARATDASLSPAEQPANTLWRHGSVFYLPVRWQCINKLHVLNLLEQPPCPLGGDCKTCVSHLSQEPPFFFHHDIAFCVQEPESLKRHSCSQVRLLKRRYISTSTVISGLRPRLFDYG